MMLVEHMLDTARGRLATCSTWTFSGHCGTSREERISAKKKDPQYLKNPEGRPEPSRRLFLTWFTKLR